MKPIKHGKVIVKWLPPRGLGNLKLGDKFSINEISYCSYRAMEIEKGVRGCMECRGGLSLNSLLAGSCYGYNANYVFAFE